MDSEQDELQRFQSVVTESLRRFLSLEIPEGLEAHPEISKVLLDQLPVVSEKELEQAGHKDSTCSICIQPFLAIIAEEETASAMESPAYFAGELGVTRLSQPWQCGHLFCRRDITKWIETGKLTCPMCRKSLVEPGIQDERTQAQDIDLQRILSGGDGADFSRVFGQQSREESNGNRSDYAGLYS